MGNRISSRSWDKADAQPEQNDLENNNKQLLIRRKVKLSIKFTRIIVLAHISINGVSNAYQSLITGASRGSGRVWAEAALKRGDKVAPTARDLKDIANLKECYGNAVLPWHST